MADMPLSRRIESRDGALRGAKRLIRQAAELIAAAEKHDKFIKESSA